MFYRQFVASKLSKQFINKPCYAAMPYTWKYSADSRFMFTQ